MTFRFHLIHLNSMALALLWLILPFSAKAGQPDAAFIDEAHDYLYVKPSHSLRVIQQHQNKVGELTLEQQFRYYRTGFWAAAYVYDNQLVAKYAQSLASMVRFDGYGSSLAEVLTAVSVWLRRNQDYQGALNAARCASAHASTATDIARIAGTSGITLLLTKDSKIAEGIFQLGLEIAEYEKNEVMHSVFTNNLGLIDLHDGRFDAALLRFSDALMINERDARITGTAINLTNMLLVAYLQQDWVLFKRLDERAKRRIEMLDSNDLTGYYQWLHAAYSVRDMRPVPKSVEDKLKTIYSQIVEPTVLYQLSLLAKAMAIKIDPKTTTNSLNQPSETILPLLCKQSNKVRTSATISSLLEAKFAAIKASSKEN